ncbi:MAG: leucine-rich repeat domain-containing protein [Treponema sp.]|nr:leucine-rich repeat domain-containing protein [Treponema sp.]
MIAKRPRLRPVAILLTLAAALMLGAWKGEELTALGGELYGLHSDRYITLDLTQITETTSLGDSAFFYCESLVSVKIGGGVTEIGEEAFDSCLSLESITIGNSVTSIDSYAFNGCKAGTIIFTGTLQQWNSITKDSGWFLDSNIKKVICSDYTVYL